MSVMQLMVRQVRFEGKGIHSFELVEPEGGELPAFTAGSHLDVDLGNGVVRQYSLSNDPAERHRYVIAVLRDEAGRGGSKAVHSQLQVGATVAVSEPRNHFELAPDAERVVLLAGGIGITPLKSMAHSLKQHGADFELHYCAKAPAFAAFRDELESIAGERLHLHFDGGDPAKSLDVTNLLREPAPGTHVYYCGPGGFMKACASATGHWPDGTVHSEHFKAPDAPAGTTTEPGAFIAKIQSTGQLVGVAPSQSLVAALADAGVRVETSCESGLCGTCKLHYLSGDVEHADYILSDDEHREYLTACVSRAKQGVLVLDL